VRHAARAAAAAAALAVGLGGCAAYTLVEPRRVRIAETYSVEPQIAWSAVASGKIEAWTVDGFFLQAVRFYRGIEDGEPLVPGGPDEPRRPRFRAAMAPTEIVELFVDTFSRAARIEVRDLRPAPFGTAPGFRFEGSWVTARGLEREITAAGAVLHGRLHLIVYEGAALHHFGKHRDDVERLIRSVRLE
jgi:hypothetical protein